MCRTWFGLAAVILLAPAAAGAQTLADDPRVASALDLLETWVEGQRAYERIPGLSMAVVHDQEVLWSGAFGFADLSRRTPATTQTIYSICSISKLFTSIAVMQLRDQGKLRLDDPAGRHLSWFDIEQRYAESPPVTIRGMLTHSSGLPRESDYPYWSAPDFHFPTRDEMMEGLSKQKTLYPADTYYQYSNLAMTLLGEVVGAASERPYAEYVRRNILGPLGLESTTPEIPAEHRRLATGYGAHDREGERSPLVTFQARAIAPAAGYASTVEDLARFASWQFRLLEEGGSEVLKANTLREMHRVHWVDPDWEVHRGLGFGVWRNGGKTFVGHGGSCPGYRSHLLLQTDEKFAATVMTNAIDVNSGKYTRNAYKIVWPAVAAAVEGPGGSELPDPGLADYPGTYDTAWGGEYAVLRWEQGLAMLYLPNDDPRENLVKLRHVESDTFRRVRDDDALGESIVFERDEAGQVVRFKRHSNYYPKVR